MVEVDDVLAPVVIQGLKQDYLFDVAGNVGTHVRSPLGRSFLHRGHNSLTYFLVSYAFFLGPIDNRKGYAENLLNLVLQAHCVPLFRVCLGWNVPLDELIYDFEAEFCDLIADVFGRHDLSTLLEDDLSLVVEDVVVFEDVFANFKVARFDLLLRLLQRLVDPGMRDGFAGLETETRQDGVHSIGPKYAHQVVLETQEEFRCTRVSLTAGASTELIVDPPALVTFCSDDVEAACGDRFNLVGRNLGTDRC